MSRVGITLGDPAGIGYEITAKALLSGKFALEDLVLIGNRRLFLATAAKFGIDTSSIGSVEFADVLSNGLTFENMKFGIPQRSTGELCVKTIEKGVELAMDGKIDGICTAPIHREALALAGSRFVDHTGMLASLTNSTEIASLYELQKLRTILLSRHVSMEESLKRITTENLKRHIRLADLTLTLLGAERRRIAVAALNPHGGEDGLTGDTERKEIVPAIMALKDQFDVHGPVPADVVFHYALEGRYDIVLSLFHDQAHIALKTFDFYRTVDMTIGLPFLRVSVDHGPGYDRAGTGTGIETNLVEAIGKTLQYAPIYRKAWKGLKQQMPIRLTGRIEGRHS